MQVMDGGVFKGLKIDADHGTDLYQEQLDVMQNMQRVRFLVRKGKN